jgi:alpha-tubulin suppressor-like RCC1 family protein
VAIGSDGTLWVSEKPETYGRANLAPAPIPPLVQFGSDTNWQNVISDYHYAVVLLKRDGTLWHWGTNDFSNKSTWPGLRAFQPVQLGHDSDWAKIARGSGSHYAWKKDGTAWGFHFQPEWTTTNSTTTFFGIPGVVIERFTPLDGAQWNAFAYYGWYEVGLREDGTLWIWTAHDPTSSKRILSPKPIQVGSDSDWVALGNGWPTVVALKKNGTLWRWPVGFRPDRPYLMATMQPIRMGTHSDWVGMTSLHDGTVSLAADGSLWFWQNWDDEYGSHAESGQPMLRPSRKPRFIENIFTARL